MATKRLSVRQVALKHGFRSGLEEKVSDQLKAAGVKFTYEEKVIKYTIPESYHTYTPDFVLCNGVIVETKGRFTLEDRKKHLLIKKQRPDLDIRFVFTNSKAKISKKSSTTYAAWCDKYGFIYADKEIPGEWYADAL